MQRPVRLLAGLLLALAALWPAITGAAVPAGYRFSTITDAVPPEADYKAQFADQQFSVATTVNNKGILYGFRVTGDGLIRSFNILFGSNPKMTAVDREHFMSLSAGEPVCWWIFCNTEMPWGIYAWDTGALSAFQDTLEGDTVIAGSLPFVLYPGNFVDENSNGIIATTQVSATEQHGVLIHATGMVDLTDVPWLIAINDLAEPLLLAYGANDGGCFVYGPTCLPPQPASCTGEDDHHDNGVGVGHESHGNGNGYGHDECAKEAARNGSNGTNGALLIRLLADAGTVRYRFPSTVVTGDTVRKVTNVFPLAINDTRAILRGDITVGNQVYGKRLLSCVLNPAALDAGADGTVDCVGGMTVVGGIAGSIRVGTVLGFSLNNAGLLTGDLGYNDAGIGAPFVVDVTAATPEAVLIRNLASGTDSWELNTITDMNQSGRMVGYGYKDCRAAPEAFFIDPDPTAPASALRFGRGAFENPGSFVAGSGPLSVRPTLAGGSGNYEFRVYTRTPAATDWTLLSDWSATAPKYAPGSYRGDVCFRIDARDTAAPDAVQQAVVRYTILDNTNTPPAPDEGSPGGSDAGTGSLAASTGTFRITDLIGGAGGVMLLALAVLGLRRRRNR